MTKWIVVFKVSSCYDTGFTVTWMDEDSTGFASWRIWVPVPPVLFACSLPCWRPPPSSQHHLFRFWETGPSQDMHQLRRGIVLEVCDATRFWCVDSSSVWKTCVRVLRHASFWSLLNAWLWNQLLSPLLPLLSLSPPWHKMEVIAVIKSKACLASQILANHSEAINFLSDAKWW